MTSKNLEREFRIEVIASMIENTLINNDVKEQDLYDISEFISGEEINKTNFYFKGNIIRTILLELNPELSSINIKISNNSNDSLTEYDTEHILKLYKKYFGDFYKIKSLKKEMVKTLTKTR